MTEDEDTNNGILPSEVTITRRKALLGTATATVMGSVGVGSTSAQTSTNVDFAPPVPGDVGYNPSYPIEPGYESSMPPRPVPAQFRWTDVGGHTVQLTELNINKLNTTLQTGQPLEGENVISQVLYKPDFDNSFRSIAEATYTVPAGTEEDTFHFTTEPSGTGELYWTGERNLIDNGTDVASDPISLAEVQEYMTVKDADEMASVSPGDSELTNYTTITLRFQFVSEQGTVAEQTDFPFTLCLARPLGFGHAFGHNFGQDVAEGWVEDFYKDPAWDEWHTA